LIAGCDGTFVDHSGCKSNSSTQAARHAVTPFPCMQGCSAAAVLTRVQSVSDMRKHCF
jgi:hypothetical protein